jgi:hypothetical protein
MARADQDRRAASPGQEEAERVACGVQVDANVILRLALGQDRSGGDRVLTCCCQILDGDIEMHLHLLIAGPGRPHGGTYTGSVWKDRPAPPSRERRVTQPGSSCSVSPAEQTAVEVRQRARIGGF